MMEPTTRFDRPPGAYEPPAPGSAQHMEAARTALARGDHDGAEQALLAAVALAERAPDGAASLGAALTRLGELKHQQGHETDAEQVFRRALAINEQLLGAEHPDLVVLLNDLSRLYLKRGAHADAEPLLLRLHAIKLSKGEDHPEVATVLASLASVRQALGRYDSAEQLWRRVLEIREQTLAPHHFSIATALEHLGETCAARGKLNEALRHRVRALAMRELTLDPGHPSLRTARERIADLQLQASEEMLDIDVADAPRHPPVWSAPLSPAPAPVPRAATPVKAPPAVLPQVAPARIAERATLPEPLLLEDEVHDEDPGRRDATDAGGLHLVSVAGAGDSSRAVIMPYYADALALANAEAEDEFSDARQAGGMVATSLAFLRQRRTAFVATLGAGAIVAGAVGTAAFARGASREAQLDEAGGFRPAPAAALTPVETGAVADSAVDAGSIDRDAGTVIPLNERTGERAGTGSRLPDGAVASAKESRSSTDAARSAESTPAATAALPRTLNVRLDSMTPTAAASAAGASDALSAKVTLPSGGRLRSSASAAEPESQPALLIVSPTPVYPSALYTKGVAGSAAVEFVVDTSGRVDLSTFKSQSNHEMFTESVRQIMPGMRFVPSTRNGRRVRTSMRMRFEFDKSGVSSSRPN